MIKALFCVMITWIVITYAAMGQGSVCAHGGGADWDLESHREMVRWMIERARPEGVDAGEGGAPVRAVILGAVPREPTDPDAAADAFRREGAEATALVIVEANADSPEIGAAIESADIVWIRGGDQGRYVNWWKGKATERAIRRVFEKGGVVGGTSAGCAILGEVTYDARNNSLRPEQALADPYHENLTLTDGFLSLVPGVLFDSHFTERGRIGRLPVMMARAAIDFDKDVLGVGVDHGTALLIDPKRRATVIGRGTVSFLRPPPRSGMAIQAGSPPQIWDIVYDRVAAGGIFEINPQRVESLPGTPPHVRLAESDGNQGRCIITGTWARDGAIEERIILANSAMLSSEPAASVLLGEGMELVQGNDQAVRLRRAEGLTAPATAAVQIRLSVPSPRQAVSHYRTSSPAGASFCGATLRIVPEGVVLWWNRDEAPIEKK